MSTPDQRRRATEFLERLLAEPQLRADFRRQPVTTCRAFDLDELADELETGTRGTVTLEQRESRSGMAGVMIAAAAEGVGLADLLARHATEMGVASAATASGLIEQIGAEGPATAKTGGAAGDRPGEPAISADHGDGDGDGDGAEGAALPVSAPGDPAGLPPEPAPPAGGPSMVAAAATAAGAADPAGLPPATAQPPAPTPEAPPASQGEVQRAARPQAAPTEGAPEQPRPQREPPAQRPAAEDGDRAAQVSSAVLEQVGDTPQGYPGDDAPQAHIAAWMARRAAAAGLPEELPVMASLVESGLANLRYGDRDSVGFFQMRLGIWNRGEYRGYPDDAELQLKWFLDQATALKTSRVAAGDAEFGRDPSAWGTWIADVERPAEEYRGRYQGQLDAARGLLASGRPAAPADQAVATPPAPAAPVSAAALAADAQAIDPRTAAASSAERAVALAKRYLGNAYVWGGASPETGFDCSGLVQYVYKQAGVELPRVTHLQFEVGQEVGRNELRAGDLVFFRDSTGYIHHEGMYLDDGRFLHAPRTGDVIKISSLDEPYFAGQFAGARRVSEAGAAITEDVEMMRRTVGELADARQHDARVLPVIDPGAPRPGRGR